MNLNSNGKNNRLGLVIVVFSALAASTGCVHRIARAMAAWKSPVNRQAQAQSAVRQALRQQTQGAFDPGTGDRRIQQLNGKLRVDPQDVDARVELGRNYETYSMDEAAFEQFSRALNLDADCLPALQGLARVASHDRDRAGEALPMVRAFAKGHPESVEAMSALGSLLDATGDLAEAETLYRRALESDPAAGYLHNNLGYNLLLQNRTAAAALEFHRALELNPQSRVARNNLGLALARMGDRPGALRAFLDGGADRATAHNNIAAVLLEQDRFDESRAELLEALSARSFFAPALENFKLLLERDRERRALPASVPLRPMIPKDWLLPPPAAPEN